MSKRTKKRGGTASQRAQRRAEEQRQQRIRLGLFAIGGVAVVALIIYAVSVSGGGGRPAAHPDEQAIPDEGRAHIQQGLPLEFSHYPPSSGTHYDSPLPWGFYEAPQLEGNWVHSMEHGGVVALYNCSDGCPELVAQLRMFYDDAPRTRCNEKRLVVTPYSRGMETSLTVVAWGRQLDLQEFDQEALMNFFLRHEDRGPERIPCA